MFGLVVVQHYLMRQHLVADACVSAWAVAGHLVCASMHVLPPHYDV